MKRLLLLALGLLLVVVLLSLFGGALGLTEDRVLALIEHLRRMDPFWLAGGIILLMVADLFIGVPTITAVLIAGHVLGAVAGGAAAAFGLMLMGVAGYGLGRSGGRAMLMRIGGGDELAEIETTFARNDRLTLFVCQALPMLPEVATVLAGIARMPLLRFLISYAIGTIPFSFIIAFAGAESSLANPAPAIAAWLGVSVGLLLLWGVVRGRIVPKPDGNR
jgi:uncharacterized membrane protein YdjX (TVP38/TMEM64 family)